MTKFTADEEKVARVIAMSRGADPDAPITIGNADGSVETFEIAWHGYVPLARLIAQAQDPDQDDPPLKREETKDEPTPPTEPEFKHKSLLVAPPKRKGK